MVQQEGGGVTTVAYRDGIMACDSCWADDNMQTTSMTKIDRLTSGALLGSAGDCDIRLLLSLIDKVKTPDKLPGRAELAATKTDYKGILVFPRGQVYMIDIGPSTGEQYDAQVWPANRGIAACGSGGKVALGAMGAGKSAQEAVAIACRFDINSKLPVHVVKLKAGK